LLARAGRDVTLIDQWPEHVAAMRANGLRVTVGPKDDPEAEYTVPVRAFHVHEVAAASASISSSSHEPRHPLAGPADRAEARG
jgi:ketopantoate reductase